MSAAAFTRGAFGRAAVGLLFTIAAFALALGIETMPLPGGTARAGVAATPVAAGRRQLRVESTFAVAAWSVTVGGSTTAGHGDDGSWSGTVPLGEILVTAEPVDQADARLHGLRLRVDGARDAVAWGSGAVTAVVPASAAP
jgi:hypothetical protein